MFSLTSFALAISAVSSASALVVPRATAPAGWATNYLEPYDTYHTRYLAIGCSSKHNTAFFDACCHPLSANQSAATTLPSQCLSSSAAASAVSPTPTASEDDEGDDCEEDDGDDDTTDVPTSTPTPTSTSTSRSTPTLAVTSTKKASTSTPTSTKKASTSVTATPTTTKASSKSSSPASTASAASGAVNSGGVATFFYQNDTAGACGTVHKDSDLIAAMDKDRYGNLSAVSSLCGKQVKITNTKNGKSVTVTVADACPTCENSNSIDLSVGAFTKIATEEEGEVPITWSFV